MDNLVTACEDCNVGKSDKPLSDSPAHIQAAAEEAFDRSQLVRSLVVEAKNKTGVSGEPVDAPDDILDLIESEAQALVVSIGASNSSQSFVADVVGISKAYISNLCAGKRPIPSKLVGPFCAATGSNLLRQYRQMQAAQGEGSEVRRLAEMLRRAAA
jgi:hypothetical protein